MVLAAVSVNHANGQARPETLVFTCSTKDHPSGIIIKIGDAKDGFPLDSYTIGGIEQSDFVVQYIFQVSSGNFSSTINTVTKKDEGRIHKSASLKITSEGMVLEGIEFNIDAEKPEDTVVASRYPCKLPHE